MPGFLNNNCRAKILPSCLRLNLALRAHLDSLENLLLGMISNFNLQEQNDYNYCPSVEILGRPRVTQ